MFYGYKKDKISANGVTINFRIGGRGPALLLVHGHPQTHVIWHKVAESLAEHFTVVAADLRGYGDSEKPSSSEGHIAHSNRVMAADLAKLMENLGFKKFSILAHDRGARVSHRLALDHVVKVERMVLLDIAPTLAMYQQTNEEFARAYWHWFFLIRPAPLPEKLIEADPEQYLRSVMGTRSAGMAPFSPDALKEYLRCLKQPNAATGICEDYRASATIDLEHDQEDIDNYNRLSCPLLVLWGSKGTVGRCFNPLAEWEKVAKNVRGKALSSGHYIPEEVPQNLLQEVYQFFGISRDVST